MPTTYRQPAIYLSHGGGPCFWIEFPEPLGPKAFEGLRNHLEGLLKSLPERPKAIVVISAHWEATLPTVSIAREPPMLFDYYGFPPHTYDLKYPAKGAPEIAARVSHVLKDAGIESASDSERGFDHGVFVPFLIMDPMATIPVVMLSLQKNLDPAQHLAIGAALAPLRDENVLIIGSGSSYHNLTKFSGGDKKASAAFDGWLTETITKSDGQRRAQHLTDWQKAPFARECHPREEHLLPLMVVAGAGAGDVGRRTFNEEIGGKTISCFSFGTMKAEST